MDFFGSDDVAGGLEEEEFMKAVQMKLENTILLPGGSYAQRVQVTLQTFPHEE